MYKFFLSITLLVILTCLSAFAETPSQKQNNTVSSKTVMNQKQTSQTDNKSSQINKVDFNKQMQDLENQRRKIQLKIYQLRVQLIREDSELLMMHNEIMKMHKKLATELNNNEKMKGLLIQAQQLDTQIADLLKSKQKK